MPTVCSYSACTQGMCTCNRLCHHRAQAPLPCCVCVSRLLVIVCENKLLLYDLNTRKPYEVSRAVLDGKAPSCVTFLFRGGRFSPGGQPDPDNLMTSPVLAVGCSDGVVRLLHLATLRVSHDHTNPKGAKGACLQSLHNVYVAARHRPVFQLQLLLLHKPVIDWCSACVRR